MDKHSEQGGGSQGGENKGEGSFHGFASPASAITMSPQAGVMRQWYDGAEGWNVTWMSKPG
jgi:hypothetical protein